MKKVLYGIQKPPRAWYLILERYIQKQGIMKGNAENNLYIKVDRDNILIIELYVDHIILKRNDDWMSQKFERYMKNGFEMSFLGELTFFLGL
jgi:hypothetical protein